MPPNTAVVRNRNVLSWKNFATTCGKNFAHSAGADLCDDGVVANLAPASRFVWCLVQSRSRNCREREVGAEDTNRDGSCQSNEGKTVDCKMKLEVRGKSRKEIWSGLSES